VELNYYVDLSYSEYVASYREGQGTDPAVLRSALALEARGYRLARRILSFSKSSARFITDHFGLEPRKISAVLPGANIDEAVANDVPVTTRSPGTPFVIGFVGMDWRRKRLGLLAQAVSQLRAAGKAIVLRVVGDAPPEILALDGVEYVGRIDKAGEMYRFSEFLAGCDLGALLSEAEGLPISLLEFLRMGKPVMGCDVNGIPDVVTPDVGILLPGDIGPDDVAKRLHQLIEDHDSWTMLQANAQRRRHEFGWAGTAQRLSKLLSP
jgi:glycosyltransferase involved in cell wall biosynthesis